MSNKKRGKPAKTADRKTKSNKSTHRKPAKGAPRDTERTCEEQIDGGAAYMASPRLKTPVKLDKRRGSRAPFAAQGVNSDLTNAKRCNITENDIHRPVSRTQPRQKRDGQ